jgi:hypothetical protein
VLPQEPVRVFVRSTRNAEAKALLAKLRRLLEKIGE